MTQGAGESAQQHEAVEQQGSGQALRAAEFHARSLSTIPIIRILWMTVD
jgi:hypothetical protein